MAAPVIPTVAQTVMKTIRLNSGAVLPQLGLGTWKIPTERTAHIVKEAIRVGFTHLDSASDYTNEMQIGEGIKDAYNELGVKREDLWVTSKLWNSNHRKEHVRPALEATLKDLSLSYLDLYLVHFPLAFKWREERTGAPIDPTTGQVMFDRVPMQETWQAMEELVDAGLVKNIGVSNVSSQLLWDMLSYARIPPAVNQIEIHPYLQQEEMVKFCASIGVHVTAYSPLGSTNYAQMGGIAAAVEDPFDREEVHSIAAKHNATPVQILLAWGLNRGYSVITKPLSLLHLQENFGALKIQLDEADMALMTKLNRNTRFNDPVRYWGLNLFA